MPWLVRTLSGGRLQIALDDPSPFLDDEEILVDTLRETPRIGRAFEDWNDDASAWVVDLELFRADAIRQIDELRFSLIELTVETPLDREYAAKLREAERSLGPRPYLDREAARRGEPIETTCARVISRARAAEEAEAQQRGAVSAIAVGTKDAIRRASSASEIEQLIDQALTDMTGVHS